jgi:hypothetical protein
MAYGLPLLPDWMYMIRDGQRLNYIKNPDGYCGRKSTGISYLLVEASGFRRAASPFRD